jgi:hypothetical protein
MTALPPPSPPLSPEPAEQPTASARIRFRLRPVEIEGAAENVPAVEAHTLITTFGMIIMGVGGIIGADYAVRIAAAGDLGWFLGLALADVALALAVILLIARRDRTRPAAGARDDAAGPQDELAVQLRMLEEVSAQWRARAEYAEAELERLLRDLHADHGRLRGWRHRRAS